ncbi:hypothetical protein BDK51DRAFT_48475 [Blyttiomyces helicus]|uniref:Choice-of-anchor A domain-containing protein n=1 Tax=Blyttiomyces helicus TaxID=388810 RepID=A0A4P9WCN0_9FUNG|nr:hypothetical protein BDK51DRAFT_48475 [Blyttiomyces helicus]|eukprot:RKO89363.1 hypothetical protein BDK51DRAFT_48475 [Blyttiomyces helicus]
MGFQQILAALVVVLALVAMFPEQAAQLAPPPGWFNFGKRRFQRTKRSPGDRIDPCAHHPFVGIATNAGAAEFRTLTICEWFTSGFALSNPVILTMKVCATPPIGELASQFHVFTKDFFDGSDEGGVVHGRLASIGPIHATNWSIGMSLFPQPQTCPSLAAAAIHSHALSSHSAITMLSGDVGNGHISYASRNAHDSESRIGHAVVAKLQARSCQFKGATDLALDAVGAEIDGLSRRLKAMKPTTVAMSDARDLTRILVKVEGLQTEVVEVPGRAMDPSSAIVVFGDRPLAGDTTVVINVYGAPEIHLKHFDTTTFNYPSKIIWNFHDAKRIVMERMDMFGTILAPNAHIGGG